MTPQALAIRLGLSSTARRAVGCGCLGIAALIATPFLLVASLATGALGNISGTGGGDQSDPFEVAGAALVTGTGEPLPPGSFRVSQGFGCTAVSVEAPPPASYHCPPAADPAALRFHSGIDLAAAAGTPVFAVIAGTVHVVVSQGGFGLHEVLVPTGAGVATATYLYGHLSAVLITDGTEVPDGAAIGLVGSTGNSTGPHLHFEVDVGRVPVNPCAVFPAGYLVPAGVAATGCVATAL